MNRLATTLTIVKHALGLIRKQKLLLIFPLLNVVAIIGSVAMFLLPLRATIPIESLQVPTSNTGDISVFAQPALLAAILMAFYLLSVFVATFLNVAFYSEILQTLGGHDVSIGRGLSLAGSKVASILTWSLFAATVGLVIKAIQDKLGLLGQWIAGLAGISWSVASVFVIPVMIREEQRRSPFEYLRISSGLIRKTWGEGLIGFAGIALVGFIVVVCSTLLVIRIVFWVDSLAAVVAGFVFVAAIIGLLTVATQVFRCSLYVYATEGVAPGTFDEDFFDRAWKVKRRD